MDILTDGCRWATVPEGVVQSLQHDLIGKECNEILFGVYPYPTSMPDETLLNVTESEYIEVGDVDRAVPHLDRPV